MSHLQTLALGVDVSKGYIDLTLLNPAGTRLLPNTRFDDTAAGQQAVRAALQPFLTRDGVRIEVGLEASGGLERNWLVFFRELLQDTAGQVFRLNPLAVKKFRDQELHYNVTDALSALEIARYLQTGRRRTNVPYEEPQAGALTLYRFVINEIDRLVELKNELHALLPSVQPELVQFCRKGLPAWVLELLEHYPTAAQLSRARPATVARIPYVTVQRAGELVAAAKQSVASLTDEDTALTVKLLAGRIREQDRGIGPLKEQLCNRFLGDRTVELLTSIPGIGPWTAVQLRLEIGDFSRFGTEAALIAFAGLNPRYFMSGDGEVRCGISKRGQPQIRAALWMAAFASLLHNPVVRRFYEGLKAAEKPHDVALTACMGKLLRIAYACVVSDKEWDPSHDERLKQQQATALQRRQAQQAEQSPPKAAEAATSGKPGVGTTASAGSVVPAVGALSAPVSYREAKKRAAAAPQRGPAPEVRGRATTRRHDNPSPDTGRSGVGTPSAAVDGPHAPTAQHPIGMSMPPDRNPA